MNNVADQVNIAMQGGVTGIVLDIKNTNIGRIYTVKVADKAQLFQVLENKIALYGVNQMIEFYQPKNYYTSTGRVTRITYNKECKRLEYEVMYNVIERFSSILTPRTCIVTEDRIVKAIVEKIEKKCNCCFYD